ncbi:hypothetical protein K0U00_22580, partial [Paenibacillus sepulcri]|nr:hypothetical protein [Paenibacillus sepulcri]
MLQIKKILQTRSIHPQRLMEAVDAFIKHLETKAYGLQANELLPSPRFGTCERLIVWLEEELIPWFEQMSVTDNRSEIRKAKQYISAGAAFMPVLKEKGSSPLLQNRIKLLAKGGDPNLLPGRQIHHMKLQGNDRPARCSSR